MSDDEEAMGSDDDSNASYMSEGGSGGQTSEEDNDDHGYGTVQNIACHLLRRHWTHSRDEGSKCVG